MSYGENTEFRIQNSEKLNDHFAGSPGSSILYSVFFRLIPDPNPCVRSQYEVLGRSMRDNTPGFHAPYESLDHSLIVFLT